MSKSITITLLPLVQLINGQNCNPKVKHTEHTILTTYGTVTCHNTIPGNKRPQSLPPPPSCEAVKPSITAEKDIFTRYCPEVEAGDTRINCMKDRKRRCK